MNMHLCLLFLCSLSRSLSDSPLKSAQIYTLHTWDASTTAWAHGALADGARVDEDKG